MRRRAGNRQNGESGFSMVELLIVVVIILVIAALAIPNMTQAITTFRLRGSISSLAGILQEARIIAVKQNMITKTELGTISGASVAFVDLPLSSKFDDAPGKYSCFQDTTQSCSEPVIQFATGVSSDFGNVPTSLDSNTYLGYDQKDSTAPFQVGFNQRGLPCTPAPVTGRPTTCSMGTLSTTKSSSNGFIYYFKITSAFGTRWSSLTITPAGRIRVWTLNGTTWN